MKMGMTEQQDAGYDLMAGIAETRVRLLKIEHMESTHEESHGLGVGHSRCPSAVFAFTLLLVI
jgi:hypothetical protein